MNPCCFGMVVIRDVQSTFYKFKSMCGTIELPSRAVLRISSLEKTLKEVSVVV